MNTLLCLSPHLDDAVFSCAIKICRARAAGRRVVIATVFSEGKDHAARREEDTKAAALLGAETVWLGFADAPDRSAFYSGFEALIFGRCPEDRYLPNKLVGALEPLIDRLHPVEVCVPLAAGTHVDHRLCFEAARQLRRETRLKFYEDRPYSLAAGMVELRLRELGHDTHPIGEGRLLRGFRALPHVRSYLPPGARRKHCEAWLLRPLAQAPQAAAPSFETMEADAAEAFAACEAAAAYISQFAAFCGSRESLRRRDQRHARHLHLHSPRAERYWTLPPHPTP